MLLAAPPAAAGSGQGMWECIGKRRERGLGADRGALRALDSLQAYGMHRHPARLACAVHVDQVPSAAPRPSSRSTISLGRWVLRAGDDLPRRRHAARMPTARRAAP
jgi:hypothetical protein